MFSEIPLSLGMRQSILAYRALGAQIDAAQTRIASGKRIGSPFDGPAAYFTSSALSARAYRIDSLMDGISKAKGALQAAMEGVAAIESLLSSAQSLANSARLSANTLVKVTGAATPVLTAATVIVSGGGSASTLRNNDTVTVSDGTTTATYTASTGDDVQDLLNAINNTANLKVDASLTASGQIQLQATGTNNITIGGTFGGVGTLLGVTGLSAGTTTFTASATRANYAAQFDAIRSQIATAAADAGFDGLFLLAGGSQSFALNENGTSSLALTGVVVTAANLGVAASVNQFQIDGDIDDALADIVAAFDTLKAQTLSFDANLSLVEARSDFNQAMIDTLMAGADDLVLADVDADSAILLALQARQKLVATSLSIAGNSDDLALRLFQPV